MYAPRQSWSLMLTEEVEFITLPYPGKLVKRSGAGSIIRSSMHVMTFFQPNVSWKHGMRGHVHGTVAMAQSKDQCAIDQFYFGWIMVRAEIN